MLSEYEDKWDKVKWTAKQKVRTEELVSIYDEIKDNKFSW